MEGEVLEEFGTGSIADEQMNQYLVHKWEPLLDGVKRDDQKKVLARMFENQTKHLQSRVMLGEQTKAADVGPFTKFIFPILRRVFPNLIAQDIVSVQPMTAPVGAVFFFEHVYATTKGQVTAGDFFVRDFNKFYSSEFVDGESIGTGDGSATAFSATLQFTPIRNGVGFVKQQVLTVKHTESATVNSGVADGAGAITGTNIASGSVNFNTGAITVTFTAAPDNGTAISVEYEYLSEANAQVPQVNLQVNLREVRAHSRKLKALVSSEAAEDLRAFHGIDAESELVTAIADEIALEIDREILTDLQEQASGGTATFDRTVPSGITELDHLRALLTQLSNVSNAIHKATLRSPANWIVVSPEVAALIEQLSTHGDFRPNVFPAEPVIPMPQGQFGIFPMGTLLNRWAVYRDPFFDPVGEVLLGLKGKSFMDAGFAWAPYIPLQVTATFLDPNDFTLKKGMRTRYAKEMLRPEFYGKVTVTNL